MNEYYGELCTQIYEKSKSIADGKELEFFLSFVQDKKMKVLEPMCGNGRMLIPFMEKGIDIEGFDISEEMLRVCKLKGQKLNFKPNVSHGKIEEFKGDKNYDLIMIPFGSFSLLPDELVKDSLNNMKTILEEDGKLLLTVMTNKGTVEDIPDWIETNRHYLEGNEIIEYKKVNYDQVSKMLNTKLKYQLVKDGQIEKAEIMDFPIRLYESGEFENILKTNGFDEIILHEVINGYGEGSSFQVFECVI
ncbi:bifunctional 2-polyprenyl-6-hydroxyphenol methylase/3-demethylubiquinol 3-O-methyltransferase UbiG [Psychrobacillus sp. OK032]|uniref:class I SAM-dependent methyltransferase n=1 Tax=Psychrobacillus sp. OK032 TaxID=1884358 RepID=UPI000B874E3D|nr:class I SAM-dependent methyltransferase [Psychrobacillus sp. OK032]